jgi:DNA repair protein RadC
MKDLINTLSEIQIKYNPKVSSFDRPQIKSSQDAFIQFMLLLDTNQFYIKEEAAALYLNRANRVIGGYKLSSGGITGTVVDIRIILSIALKSLSCGIIIAHTHPSGELKPSRCDLEMTEKLKKAAIVMDIKLHDHLIIAEDKYYSFSDEGII